MVELAPVGVAKLGVGSLSSASVTEAPAPMPRRAKAAHSTSLFAPAKRISSAAIMASRASSIEVAPCWSRKASNISWTHRRLPGQVSALRGVVVAVALAQASCRAWSAYGNWASYFSTRAWRTSHIVPFQISPSAWTSAPVVSKP